MKAYLAPKVLIIDEMGYLPLDEMGATIFFQSVSARYQRGSIILNSNKSYGDSGSIFGDPIIATAILDRLERRAPTGSRIYQPSGGISRLDRNGEHGRNRPLIVHDECRARYSLAGWSPPESASASPADSHAAPGGPKRSTTTPPGLGSFRPAKRGNFNRP